MKRYFYIVISLFLIVTIGSAIYDQINKKSAKAYRLPCHKKSTVFERVVDKTLLKNMQQDLKNGNISVSISEERSTYMKSRLFTYVNSQKVKERFIDLMPKSSPDTSDKNSSVAILIYENDEDDPGKKTSGSKLYAGYLLFSFLLDNKLVYKIQIDFLDKGADIEAVLQCAYTSVITL